MNTPDREDAVTLEILQAIDASSNVSQRHLADRLGVALGLANLYIKRCVRKGLVKVKQAPANRYFYYLTPKGFAEKSRLTARYLSASLDFYRRAGESCAEVFRGCAERGWRRVLLCGASEFAEIASLRAAEYGLGIVGTYDPESARPHFLGRPVWRRLGDLPDFDACVLTALAGGPERYEELVDRFGVERILVPAVLGLRTAREGPKESRAGAGDAPPR